MRQGDRQADSRPDGGSDHGLPERTRIQLLAPVVRGRKVPMRNYWIRPDAAVIVRAEIDGNVYELSEEITLDKNIKHTIAIIVDRLIVKPGIEKRLTDSLETVLNLADGLAVVDTMDGNYMNFQPELFLSGLWSQY